MVPRENKITTAPTERDRHPFLRYLRTFFDVPGLVRNLTRHQELIQVMAWRDFTARFRGSFGGLLWSLLHPLVMMIVYTVVFSLFLKLRFSTDASPFTFSIYLLCGLLPWSAFSEGLQVSKEVIRANVNFVKKVVFPLEILPLNAALTSSIQQVFGFFLLIPLVWGLTGTLHWTIFFVPVIMILQLLLAIGLNWMAAGLAVYLPDFSQFLNLLLTVWMFLTPIFYPEDIVPAQAAVIFRLNPMAHLVRMYRGAYMTGELPGLENFLGTACFCFLVFLLGYFWFMHSKKGFADVL
jgi:lipopolysaccharide transport system permease protein